MASTFTDLGIEKMATGENAGTWGTKTNTNLDIIEKSIAGYVEQAVTSGGTTTLAITDGDATESTSVARHAVIKLTGTITGNSIVTVPDSVEKVYIVTNGTSGAYTVQFKTASGTGITFGVSEKTTKLVYSDGTNLVDAGFSGGGDLEGTELVLDADGDTTITADTDDQIDIKIAGADDFQFTANTFTAQSGSTIAAQALTATTITASGIVKTDDTTEATSTTDGSLQTDGGLSVAKDAVFGDDVKLLSDSAVLSFGADSDITVTHAADTGLTTNGTFQATTITATTAFVPDASDGAALGTSALEFSDLFLADGAVVNFGDDQEIKLTHVADTGLTLKHTATADDKPVSLTLQTGETDIAANDVIGKIDFQAPDESTGTDAILVAAGIEAVSEGDFSSSSNATKLSFKTGASEAAAEKMSLSSGGNLTISGDLTVSGDDITMGTNTAGNLLVADGTNFNSIAAGSLSEISTVANDDVFIAVDTSGGGLKKIARSTIVAGLATSGAISNLVEDTSPQLGGDLDTNSANILIDDAHFIADENGNEQIIFQTTSSAVNQFDVTNAASGGAPLLSATGGDSNIDLDISAKGTGHVTIKGDTNPGTIQFNCEQNSHGVQVKSPAHSAGSSAVLTLPTATGNLIGSGDTGTLPVAAIDIDGATDIGAAIVDADLFIIDDGAGGTNRKTAASRLKTYIGGGAADDISVGDAAVTIGNGSTNADVTLDSGADVVIDAAGGNVEFKDAGTLQLALDMDGTSGVQIIKLGVDSDDLVFQQYDGNEVVRIADDRRLYFFDKGGEYIVGDGTDLSIVSGNDINIPANVGLTFGDDGEKIEGDGTDLTIAGNNINLTATADVVIPANVGVTFGSGEKIEGDSTDLTITSGAKINLTATSDVHIPNDVGIVFGGASEKIEGDGTDLVISANNLTVDAAADIILDAGGNDWSFKAGGTEVLKITNSSSDVIIKPIVDAKDIIFQQRDGTEVARIEDNATFNVSSAGKFAYAGTAVTATAAELNLLDGGTSVGGSITLASGDGFVVNDGGTMKTIPASDVATFAGGGKILQVVSTRSTSHYTTTTASYQDCANFNVDITPSATSSKILVLVNVTTANTVEPSSAGTYVTIFRDTTNLGANGFIYHANASGTSYYESQTGAFHYLDSPSSTSALNYNIKFMTGGGGESRTANVGFNNSYTNITAIEIGA